MKRCTGCGEEKLPTEFHKDKQKKDGLSCKCKECIKEKDTKYLRTIDGFVKLTYQNQKRNSIKRGHKPPDYSREELKLWITSQENFSQLWGNWVASGYEYWIKPSCDRIDDYKPYSLENLKLVTWKENNSRVNHDMRNGINNKQSRPVNQYTKEDRKFIARHHSCISAARSVGKDSGVGGISNCCNKKSSSAYGYYWEFADE